MSFGTWYSECFVLCGGQRNPNTKSAQFEWRDADRGRCQGLRSKQGLAKAWRTIKGRQFEFTFTVKFLHSGPEAVFVYISLNITGNCNAETLCGCTSARATVVEELVMELTRLSIDARV